MPGLVFIDSTFHFPLAPIPFLIPMVVRDCVGNHFVFVFGIANHGKTENFNSTAQILIQQNLFLPESSKSCGTAELKLQRSSDSFMVECLFL